MFELGITFSFFPSFILLSYCFRLFLCQAPHGHFFTVLPPFHIPGSLPCFIPSLPFPLPVISTAHSPPSPPMLTRSSIAPSGVHITSPLLEQIQAVFFDTSDQVRPPETPSCQWMLSISLSLRKGLRLPELHPMAAALFFLGHLCHSNTWISSSNQLMKRH